MAKVKIVGFPALDSLEPFTDWVFVKVENLRGESKTEGGLIIPDQSDAEVSHKEYRQLFDIGTVFAVGPGYPDTPTKLKAGDRIMFMSNEGYVLPNKDDDEAIMIRESQITAKINEISENTSSKSE